MAQTQNGGFPVSWYSRSPAVYFKFPAVRGSVHVLPANFERIFAD